MTTVQVSPQCLLLSGWLLTDVQVNVTPAIHDTWQTLIYITLLLLFMFFFALLPFSWAGWLFSTPLVRYNHNFLLETRFFCPRPELFTVYWLHHHHQHLTTI
jgi:hypothetical protein